MKPKLLIMSLLLSLPSFAFAADADSPAPTAGEAVLRFTINQYVVEGATLLSKSELDAAVAPYVGAYKDFSDVERALEAVEAAYAKQGYTAVRVLLPEQELEKGTVHLRVVESHFGKVSVKDNHFVSEANALNAVPSVRASNVPRTKQISRELRLANENPARQMNVVLKAGERDDLVDADVIVTDSKPSIWGVGIDNSGSSETGYARLYLSYQNANVFKADHVAGIQIVTSPEYNFNRVKVLGGTYKIPFYRYGSSLEFFGGYSNINAVVGGLSNFQGGGNLLYVHYDQLLERMGIFNPKLTFGLDWRDYQQIELTSPPPPTVLYDEIVVVPVSVTYAAQGKTSDSNFNFNLSAVANIPGANNGKADDFATYDKVNMTDPNPHYKLIRYGADYSKSVGSDWLFRTALYGQWSSDVLVQGEQIRLGGAYGVRGFTEGSEGGDKGARLNLEIYTPEFGSSDLKGRVLVFYDAGEATTISNSLTTTIGSAGIGIRENYGDQFSLRCDVAQIENAGTDPAQYVGKWHAHLSINATF
jgi:hemolysin activation/secretion protein